MPEVRPRAREVADRFLHPPASPRGEVPHGRLGRRSRRPPSHPRGVRPRLPLAVIRRSAAALAFLLWLAARPARGQIVPITRCQAAIPCSIPMGLRPADAAAWTPGSQIGRGNTAISVSAGIEDGLKPRIDTPHVSEDPSDRAARIFLKRNPLAITPKPTATPAAPGKKTPAASGKK